MEATTPRAGVMTDTTCVHRGVPWRSCRRSVRGEPADVGVAQPVEDHLGQLAGGGDRADVPAAAGGDPVPELPEPGVSGDALDGLDRGPPGQRGALPGDPTTMQPGWTVVSDSWCFGVNPAQEAN